MSPRLRQVGQVAAATTYHFVRSLGTIFLVILLAFGAASWRLSRGPVTIPFLAQRIATAASAALPGTKITIARAQLAWEGFHRGGAPLDLRLTTITLINPSRPIQGTISHLRITLSPLALLHGRIAPITLIARHTHLTLLKSAPQPAPAPAPATKPTPTTGQSLDLALLRHVQIDDAAITIGAANTPIALTAEGADLIITRSPTGALSGHSIAVFSHGTHHARIALAITPRHGHTELRLTLAPVNLAQLLPNDPQFSLLNLPIGASIRWLIGAHPTHPTVTAHATLGTGSITLAHQSIPVASGAFSAIISARKAQLTAATLTLARPAQANAPSRRSLLHATGQLALTGTEPGSLDVTINHVAAPDLLAFWPATLAPNVRKFVQTRIPVGQARHGHIALNFALAPHFKFTDVQGGFAAQGLTLDWFNGATPITALTGTLHFDDTDHITIIATSGTLGGAALHGRMAIAGLAKAHQRAILKIHLAGPLAGIIPALNQPPLSLARRALSITNASGNFTATIAATLPLVTKLKLKQITLTGSVNLQNVAWAPVAALPISQGNAHLDVDLHHLALQATALVASTPTQITARMSLPGGTFRLLAKSTLNRATAENLGLPTGYWLSGAAPVSLAYQTQANAGALAFTIDLTQPNLTIPAFGWHKSANQPASALLSLTLPSNQPPRITRLSAQAPALTLDATVAGRTVLIHTLRIGATHVQGSLTPPARPGLAWQAIVHGTSLDLSHALNNATHRAPPRPNQPHTGLLWHLIAHFTHIRLAAAPAPTLHNATLTAFGTGTALDTLSAQAAPRDRLTLHRAGRALNLHLTATHGGALLASLGAGHLISGGTLAMTGTLDASGLNARAKLTDFRIPHAPLIGKIMQGMTLYGIADATSGPGLAFGRMIVRLNLDHGQLTIARGRAFSASLGLTAAGLINFSAHSYNLSGTIIPAYALNTLPGKIPLLGKLFRPAKGGGLFGAHYELHGPFAHPAISVDPFSALAPGVISRIFNDDPAAPTVNVSKHP